MSLSKQQMLGAVGAGVFVLCAGGLGFMLYSAWSEKVEAEEELQSQTDTFTRLNEAPVFPSRKSIESVKSNESSYVAWYDSALAFAARGDKVLPSETPPIFKQRLQAEVRRMFALEGGVEGHIAAPTFLFGFEQYLGEGGVLPKDSDVPRLAIQLDTIVQVVDIFAEAGILEVKTIQRIEPKVDEDTEEATPKNKKKNVRKGGDDADDEAKELVLQYAFEFTTRPAALVKVLNSLTASERFMTVKNLSFRETADTILERLSAIENTENQKPSGRGAAGGRRGRRAAAVVAQTDASGTPQIDPLVVDPELDAPIQVSFTLEVKDFGRGKASVVEAPKAESAEAENKADENKPVEKKDEKPAEKKEEGK